MPEKLDLKRSLPGYRARRDRFEVVELPPRRYLMVDGRGDPNTAEEYPQALAALYPVAYALKSASRELGRDYVVPPLEGLWWAEDMAAFTTARDKSRWSWTMLLLVPDWLGSGHVAAAVERVAGKANRPARLGELRLGTLEEGRCVQTLHIGPFDEEAAVLARMHEEIIPGLGCRLSGRHHEIYLSDPRRAAPERQRTILRQPVAPA